MFRTVGMSAQNLQPGKSEEVEGCAVSFEGETRQENSEALLYMLDSKWDAIWDPESSFGVEKAEDMTFYLNDSVVLQNEDIAGVPKKGLDEWDSLGDLGDIDDLFGVANGVATQNITTSSSNSSEEEASSLAFERSEDNKDGGSKSFQATASWHCDPGHSSPHCSLTQEVQMQTTSLQLTSQQNSSLQGCAAEEADASLLCQLGCAVFKLDVEARLRIRDALYRLAKSAASRTSGSGNTATAASSSFGGIETCTNPVDRTVANLLFYKMSEHPGHISPHLRQNLG